MGTALTGLEIRDTYDALLKTTDNGPLSGSLKTLTDGLGNDSALALSTGAASITGTLAVSSTATVNGSNVTIQPTTATTYALNITQNTGGYLRVGRDTSTGALYGDAYAALVVSSGAYPMIFGTNDSERMRITSTGNVGIGTSSPSQKLHVYESSVSSQAYLLVENNRARNAAVYTKTTAGGFYAGTSIGTDTLCYQIYDDVAGERLRITSTGNVGVGTTSPNIGTWNRALTLNTASGNTAYELAVGGAAQLYLAVDSSNAYLQVANATSPLRIFTGAAERMRITDTGNVGIGTSSPSGKLDVTKAGKDTIVVLDTTPFAAGVGGSIDLGGTYRTAGDLGAFTRIAAEKSNATDQNYSYDLGFYVTTNGGATLGTKVATMTSTGNVGIGTSSPTSLLNLSSATPILTLNQTTSNSEQGIEFDYSDVNYAYIRANSLTGLVSYAAGLTGGAGYFHRFIVDGSERLRITPNGITFNGDTAAANALDDYEEGTWTPSLIFSGGSTGITYTTQAGKYVKIGSKVSVNCYVVLSNKGSSTGSARIDGLPFTVPNAAGNYSPAIVLLDGGITYTGQAQGFANINSTSVALGNVTEAGSATALTDTNFSNSSAIMISLTYLVS